MKLQDLIQPFGETLAVIQGNQPESLGKTVVDITSDSRKVRHGSVFVCLVGTHTDGHQYVEKALEQGAVAVIVEKGRPLPALAKEAPSVIFAVENTYLAYAQLSSQFFGNPGQALKMVGVTGTNGKTTVTHLIQQILADEKQAVGLIGTLGRKAKASDVYDTTGHTTPMAFELQEILSDMRREGTQSVVMEVSSHALHQHRVAGCDFQVAVFTNLTQDHLDYHRTMDEYCDAKTMLFSALNPVSGPKYAVINLDDRYAERFVQACPEGVTLYTYSLENEKAAIRAQNVSYSIEGASFDVLTPQGKTRVKLQIAGKFSVYNALAAFSAGLAMGISLEACAASLERVPGVRGRFEIVSQNPFVIVDYAHTPDGLENVLNAARLVVPDGGELIAVFGCGGDRDATKRPKMGGIVERLADRLVVTSDNPRTEDPQQIITDILTGIQRFDAARMLVNADREAAIHQAIDMAKAQDVIVVAGKGHEDYQILADRVIHFDDREVVQNYVAKRSGKSPASV
jgi:UDP-N-acetylmuramoyl-L-alanyl-D-glutamate--2,6-diaminopimelate ligase